MQCPCSVLPTQPENPWGNMHLRIPETTGDRNHFLGSQTDRKKLSISQYNKTHPRNKSVHSRREAGLSQGKIGLVEPENFRRTNTPLQPCLFELGNREFVERRYVVEQSYYPIVYLRQNYGAPAVQFEPVTTQNIVTPSPFHEVSRPFQREAPGSREVRDDLTSLGVNREEQPVENLLKVSPTNNDLCEGKKVPKLSEHSTEESMPLESRIRFECDDNRLLPSTPGATIKDDHPKQFESMEKSGFSDGKVLGFRRIESMDYELAEEEPSFVLAHVPAGSNKQLTSIWNTTRIGKEQSEDSSYAVHMGDKTPLRISRCLDD